MSFDETKVTSKHMRPLVISVLSGKGGVGKSVIVFNLAERIAAGGYRALAVDADSLCGNLHLLANVSVQRGLDQYVRRELTLGQAITTLKPNLGLLARAGDDPIDSLVASSGPENLVDRLRTDGTSFDIIIIDHGSGLSTAATGIACASDVCLLVVVPQLTSVADAYGLYKYLKNQNQEIDCRLLINRAQSARDAEYLMERFGTMASQFLGSAPTPFGWLGEHPAVASSVSQQRPISQIDQQSTICQQVRGLADRLMDECRHIRPLDGGVDLAHPGGYWAPNSAINNNAATADIRG
jgi:flagellar biosynthesis protein FlhG